jgi:hypothetical protein
MMSYTPKMLEVASQVTLPDGFIRVEFVGGGAVEYPPMPEDPAWRREASRRLSRRNYEILGRVAAEQTV